MLGVAGVREILQPAAAPRWEIEHYESNVPSLWGNFLTACTVKVCGSRSSRAGNYRPLSGAAPGQ